MPMLFSSDGCWHDCSKEDWCQSWLIPRSLVFLVRLVAFGSQPKNQRSQNHLVASLEISIKGTIVVHCFTIRLSWLIVTHSHWRIVPFVPFLHTARLFQTRQQQPPWSSPSLQPPFSPFSSRLLRPSRFAISPGATILFASEHVIPWIGVLRKHAKKRATNASRTCVKERRVRTRKHALQSAWSPYFYPIVTTLRTLVT